MYVDFGGSWKKFLPYAEFTYNNNFQSSIGMAPNEALYGQRCRSPIAWEESRGVTTPSCEIVLQAQGVVELVKRRLQAAQDRHKA